MNDATKPARESDPFTAEERQQMRQELLKQSALKLENARVNYVMARAAHEALLNDGE